MYSFTIDASNQNNIEVHPNTNWMRDGLEAEQSGKVIL
jgi:hypothetical protein